MKRLLSVVLAMLLLGLSLSAFAGPCDKLSVDKRAEATKVMGMIYPHDCCDEMLDKCLAEKPSRLIRRLADEVCRLVDIGQKDKEIKRELGLRAGSMIGSGRPAKIDMSDVAWAGALNAPVKVIEYASADCRSCAKTIPMLYEAVTKGALKGKVKLGLRLFPIQKDEKSINANLAMVAAGELGKLWPYALKVFGGSGDFAMEKLVNWAGDLGLDKVIFKDKLLSPETREKLKASEREGLQNGVDLTPTYFIQGKRYMADLDYAALFDAISEEVDRVSGRLCKP